MSTELLDGLTASPSPPRFQRQTSTQGNVGECSLCSQKILNDQSLSQQMDLLQWLRSVNSFLLHSSSVEDLLASCHDVISSHYSNLAAVIFTGDELNYFTQLCTTRCIDQTNFSVLSLPITCLCPSTGKPWLLQETRNANAYGQINEYLIQTSKMLFAVIYFTKMVTYVETKKSNSNNVCFSNIINNYWVFISCWLSTDHDFLYLKKDTHIIHQNLCFQKTLKQQ